MPTQPSIGWFLSDFHAFNYLLRKLGSEQHWLTSVAPKEALEVHGEYLHGNPYENRKAR